MKVGVSQYANLSDAVAAFCKEIDMMAGEIRESYIADGSYINDEYRLSAEEAAAYVDSGYSIDPPACVAAWAVASGITWEQSAASILATKAQFDELLGTIRNIRLIGKTGVSSSPTIREAYDAKESILAQLEAIRGND